jgi:DNA-binding transcriptional LysR family regulator
MIRKLLGRTGISLDRLASLVEVQDAGSIARAAGGDPVRQSLISRQLKELSEFFEVELTKRQGRGLALTPAGERVVDAARQAFEALGDAAATCRGAPVHFTIGAGDSLIRWLLLAKACQLQASVPGITLGLRNMRTADVVRGLHDLSVDFGLIRTDAVTGNLETQPLGRIEYALYAPKNMIPTSIPQDQLMKKVRGGKTLGSQDNLCRWVLRHCPLVCLHGVGEFQQNLKQSVANAGIELQSRLECDSFPAACRAVATGSYAAVLPMLAKIELAASDVLEIRSPIVSCESRPICLAWNPRITRLRPTAVKLAEGMPKILRF